MISLAITFTIIAMGHPCSFAMGTGELSMASSQASPTCHACSSWFSMVAASKCAHGYHFLWFGMSRQYKYTEHTMQASSSLLA